MVRTIGSAALAGVEITPAETAKAKATPRKLLCEKCVRICEPLLKRPTVRQVITLNSQEIVIEKSFHESGFKVRYLSTESQIEQVIFD